MAMCMFILCSPVMQISTKAASFNLNEYYYIASALDENMVLDVSGGYTNKNGANIQLYKKNGSEAQLFKIVKSEVSGYYYIVNKGSGKVLDIQGGGTASGTNVQLYQKNGTQAQHWALYNAYNSSEHVSFKARCGKFLDVCNGNAQNGTNIWIYDRNNTKAQAFKLVPYVTYTYVTKTLTFDSLETWKEAIDKAQRSVGSVDGRVVINPNGENFYTGSVIVGIDILEKKTLRVKYPLPGPGNPYTWKTVQLPSKIRYKLHKHDIAQKVYFLVSDLKFTQTCTCGYMNEWSWEIPWPDTNADDAQTTDSVIKALPRLQVLYSLK